MIFAVIGEELGIIGMLFVLLSFAYILTKGFNIAKLALKKAENIAPMLSLELAHGLLCKLLSILA